MRKLIRLAILFSITFAAWLAYFAYTPIQLKGESVDFDIEAGSRFRSVSKQLVEQQVLKEPLSFELLARALGQASDLKAGIYIIKNGTTPLSLLDQITSGTTGQAGVTFIEGWTFAQMRQALNENESVKHMTMSETDAQILKQIGATEANPEGLFFPDTYFFTPNTSDRDILKRAYLTMQNKIDNAWASKAEGLPYQTPYQALIMASIVEKETGKASERRQIAGYLLIDSKLACAYRPIQP